MSLVRYRSNGRDEVYRLAAEALRNAFRHAAAKSVEVEIRYDQALLAKNIGLNPFPVVANAQAKIGSGKATTV